MLVVEHARVATMTGAQNSDDPLRIIEDGAVACEAGKIVYVGPSSGAPAGGNSGERPATREVIDARGKLLTPGFVDPHTHLLFAGDRAHEFALRLKGATYLQIMQQGGGIRSTVAATRAASDEELLRTARARLARMRRSGVTTVEVKSGYGLSVEQELRMLRLVAELQKEFELYPTLLALHAVPPEMDRDRWTTTVIEELLPQARARGCDAFLEKRAFTADDVRRLFEKAKGFDLHLHADQLSDGNGAAIAAELGCASAAHLEHTSPEGVKAMAAAQTAAVLLPLAAFFLRDKAAAAKPFLDAGVPVALGSNLNPGSQPIESVSLLLAAGCLLSGLSPAQALWACTSGAANALSLEDRGRLAPGLRADLVLFCTGDPDHLAYHAGVEHAAVVIARGEVVERAMPICDP